MQDREPHSGSSQRPTAWVSPAWVSGRHGVDLFLVCNWFAGIFHFDLVWISSFLFFAMFVK
jgi:hypothetical protein